MKRSSVEPTRWTTWRCYVSLGLIWFQKLDINELFTILFKVGIGNRKKARSNEVPIRGRLYGDSLYINLSEVFDEEISKHIEFDFG